MALIDDIQINQNFSGNKATPSMVGGGGSGGAVPAEWPAILQELAQTNPGMDPPVIAGGAVRDWILGRPTKDIDIFVNISPSLLKVPGGWWTRRRMKSAPPTSTTSGIHVDGVLRFTVPGCSIPVEIVCCDDPFDINRFDWGLCMASYSLDTGIVRTPMFDTDVQNQTLTHSGNSQASTRSDLAHALRIMTKYPGFRVVLEDYQIKDLI